MVLGLFHSTLGMIFFKPPKSIINAELKKNSTDRKYQSQ